MSSIYVTEPLASGKIVLVTSRGDIEVELFADQCPLACKNLIALALEGYYDNLSWHRFVPNFIIQTGDPTGTGIGGESFFGHDFADEIHQRLRFNRRGLLGMANGTDANTNGSQFFLTLAATPELQSKHTMFGRITNSTIYNLVALAESVGELGQDDQPLYPPKLLTIRVIDNPFEGQLQLRITREEKLAIQRNRKEAEQRKRERESGGNDGRKRKKNTALLSFGEAEEVEEDDTFKGPKSSHDLLKDDKRLRKEAAARSAETVADQERLRELDDRVSNGDTLTKSKSDPMAHSEKDRKARGPASTADVKIAELEASIRGLSKQESRYQFSDVETKSSAPSSSRGRSLLSEMQAQYQQKKRRKGESADRDDETSKLLRSFQTKLREKTNLAKELTPSKALVAEREETELADEMREYGGSSDDEGQGWRSHRFDFGGKAILQDKHEGDEYVTLDPRDSSSSAAIQLGFGGQDGQRRAKDAQARQGRRGRDWVDETRRYHTDHYERSHK